MRIVVAGLDSPAGFLLLAKSEPHPLPSEVLHGFLPSIPQLVSNIFTQDSCRYTLLAIDRLHRKFW